MTFVFRNNTIERFLSGNYMFSGYDDISQIPVADDYLWWYQLPIKYDETVLSAEIDSYLEKLLYVTDRIAGKQMIVITLERWYKAVGVNNSWCVDDSIIKFNTAAKELSQKYNNIKLLSISDFTKAYTDEQIIDWKFYFISQMPLNPRLAKDFSVWFEKQKQSILLKRKKCLVLDLDNTLWGGVLGEDGLDGITISGDYPGKPFHLWQEGVKQLSKDGVILAICSKNNERDVYEMWEKRNDMVLKPNDFSCIKINWNDKASNIREIASDLNIGLDSIVFVDDNPTERELIKQLLPMVSIPEWPKQPYELPMFYKRLVEDYFMVYSLTDEDRKKVEQYHQNALRIQSQATFSNLEDFLRSLDIQLTIRKVDGLTVQRVAQMTQKTNQFNLTTKRYTESDIRRLISEGALIYTLSVSDKFGDNGITGCMILCRTSSGWKIDTLLLSCRILGKGIEYAFVKMVLSLVDSDFVEACYIPTEKNSQVSEFYDKIGFTLSDEKDGCKFYETQIKSLNLQIDDLYKFK